MLAPLVLLILSAPQLVDAVRIKVRSEAIAQTDATTTFDVFSCDAMCMQCPDGRNIMIQRQKTTLGHLATWGAVGVGGYFSGGLAAGVAGLSVSQLARCSEIGFQFWKNRQALPTQPFVTHSWLGFLNVDAGLDRLVRATDKKHARDVVAAEACEKLGDPALWHRLAELRESNTTDARETTLAQTCLSHSSLCAEELEAELQINRWNPFASVHMCSPPFEVDGKHLDNLDEDVSKIIQQEVDGNSSGDGLDWDNLEDLMEPDLIQEEESVIQDVKDDAIIEKEKLRRPSELDTIEDQNDVVEQVQDGKEDAKLTNEDVVSEGEVGENDDIDLDELPVPSPTSSLRTVKIARPEDSETVKAVGEVLQGAIKKMPGQGNKLADNQIVWALSKACHTKKQLELCNALSENARDVTACKDRCCLEACRIFSSKPSCVRSCVKMFKKKM